MLIYTVLKSNDNYTVYCIHILYNNDYYQTLNITFKHIAFSYYYRHNM